MTTPSLDALIARVIEAGLPAPIAANGACWEWTRAKDARGRGRVWVGGKLMLHHRAVWEVVNGSIPAGAMLCHHCDNPACCRPDHLYVGNSKTNVADMMERRRHWTTRDPARARRVGVAAGKANTWSRGAGNPRAKLTPEQVQAIRSDRRPTRFLVAEYGVDRTSIQRIRRGDAWTI